MAGPKAAEKGTRGSFKLRAGIDFPAFDGMVRENDGAAIPDEAFQQLENVIFRGINPLDRPGLVKAKNLVVGPIEAIYDASDIGAPVVQQPFTPLGRYLYFPGVGSDGFSRVAFAFDSVGITLGAQVLGPTYDGTTPYYILESFIKGSDNLVYAAGGLYNPVAGTVVSVVVRLDPVSGTVTQLFALPAAAVPFNQYGFQPFSILEDASVALKFYAGLLGPTYDGSAAAPGTFYRDGVLEDAPTFVFVDAFGARHAMPVTFNGTVYAPWGNPLGGYPGASDTIRKRASAGVWSSLTIPAAPSPGAHFCATTPPLILGSKLWIAGMYENAAASYVVPHIISVTTGDVVTDEHAIAGSIGGSLIDLVLFNGFLYYPWLSGSGNRLGRTDGATFTDSHWNCQIAGVEYAISCMTPNVGAGGSLYAIAGNTVTGDEWIIKSTGTDTTTWTTVVKNTTGAGFINGAKMVAAG